MIGRNRVLSTVKPEVLTECLQEQQSTIDESNQLDQPTSAENENSNKTLDKEVNNEDAETKSIQSEDRQMTFEKYIRKAEEEIFPNISHFTYGKDVEKEEKPLSVQIEEYLKEEKEERETLERKERNELKEETVKKILEGSEEENMTLECLIKVSEIEKEKALIYNIVQTETVTTENQTVEGTENEKLSTIDKEKIDSIRLEEDGHIEEKMITKTLISEQINEIIDKALKSVSSKETEKLNEETSMKILENGINVVKQLANIGKMPLTKVESKISIEQGVEVIQETKEIKTIEDNESAELLLQETKTPNQVKPEEKEEIVVRQFTKNIRSTIELQMAAGIDDEDTNQIEFSNEK